MIIIIIACWDYFQGGRILCWGFFQSQWGNTTYNYNYNYNFNFKRTMVTAMLIHDIYTNSHKRP